MKSSIYQKNNGHSNLVLKVLVRILRSVKSYLYHLIILFQNDHPLDTHRKQRAVIEFMFWERESTTNIHRRLLEKLHLM